MRIGILYPRSGTHPGLLMDFSDGIKTSLQHLQLSENVLLISETIGFGGDEKEVYEKAEKLLVLEGADILIAYIDLRILDVIKPLIYNSGRLAIVVNPGANFPQNWMPQPNIVNLTLQHGFLCYLSGKLASSHNHTHAAMATSFYDCGYLHTAAMVKGFGKGGGVITYNYVNNQRYDDTFEIKQLTDYLSADKKTNCLLCAFDSVPASLFYSRLNSYDQSGNLHLFVSPMMLEQKALEHIADGFNFSIDGYIPWHAGNEISANQVFNETYQQKTKRATTVFSLLGWETGLIIQQILITSDGKFSDGAAIAARLNDVTIRSPRGELKLDKETHYFIAPFLKKSISLHSNTALFEYMDDMEKEWKEFVADPLQGVSSGWTNTYLCY